MHYAYFQYFLRHDDIYIAYKMNKSFSFAQQIYSDTKFFDVNTVNSMAKFNFIYRILCNVKSSDQDSLIIVRLQTSTL